MKEYIILFATKDNDIFYISNTNPVIWSSDIKDSKLYYTRYTAEFEVLRDYDNYKSISTLISNNKLDSLYVATVTVTEAREYIEKGRAKIL